MADKKKKSNGRAHNPKIASKSGAKKTRKPHQLPPPQQHTEAHADVHAETQETTPVDAPSRHPASRAMLRLMERRKHPRFLLSREQFREVKSGRIFSVYDLSASGLSIKIDAKYWEPGAIISGVLNLHPDSIELSPRLVCYHGDRAALKLEGVSTYSRSVLERALSPHRLGASLTLIRERLPIVDYWFHGVCNTDLLLRLNKEGDVAKVELFFSNYYWNWSETMNCRATGVCQSIGQEEREDMLLAEEPVELETIDIKLDAREDERKTAWAKGIIDSSPLEPRLKDLLLRKFEPALG